MFAFQFCINAVAQSRFFVCFLLVLLCIAQSASGQEATLRQSEGPHYVGEPVIVQVALSSYEGDEEVSASYAGDDDRIKVTGPTVSQGSRSMMSSFNGQFTSKVYKDYKFNFQVTSNVEEGIEVGPFKLKVGERETVVGSRFFRFEKVSTDPDQELKITLERDSIFVGEEMPLNIEWTFAGDLNELDYVFGNLDIRSPIFDDFQFKDLQEGKRNRLSINTAAGKLEIEADATQGELNGKRAIRVAASRMLIAERPGKYEDIVSSCRTKRVTRWKRDFFGSVAAAGLRPAFAVAEPISFTVKPLPLAGQPDNFTGAVGEGFSLEVSANRSVVRLGDPIALDISIRGNGNIEKLSLPNFAGGDALPDEQFQLPSELPAGTFNDNVKQFNINVRVKDQGVTQIPALPFSWFNPNTETYETTYSKPIALQVMETEVLRSEDVFTAVPQKESDGDAPSIVAKSMSFVGANLAIEKNTSKLLASIGGTTVWYSASGYVLSAFAIVCGLLLRKRLNEDPTITSKRQTVRAIRERIQAANKQKPQEAAQSISEALRQAIIMQPNVDRIEADRIIAECENLRYAPDASDASDQVQALAKRATEEFERITKGL